MRLVFNIHKWDHAVPFCKLQVSTQHCVCDLYMLKYTSLVNSF